ncbi:hypothetical protein QCA50_010845 [Cerrena zonata]|uniref:Uncharacterized protein n=1 Tax=Cerrena zonata TaxID=2478898 RepID=A0AAW0FX15_9APHY
MSERRVCTKYRVVHNSQAKKHRGLHRLENCAVLLYDTLENASYNIITITRYRDDISISSPGCKAAQGSGAGVAATAITNAATTSKAVVKRIFDNSNKLRKLDTVLFVESSISYIPRSCRVQTRN